LALLEPVASVPDGDVLLADLKRSLSAGDEVRLPLEAILRRH
jgi:hypothetical protein